MARNEEKQLGRLNRWLLQKEKQEFLEKNPKRPKLYTLTTAEDIKKWLPSIVRDIDINLQQSQVTCYTHEKVDEYREEVNRLQKEYKAFLKKFKSIIKGDDPDIDIQTPWTERGYTSTSSKKRKIESNDLAISDDVDGNNSSLNRISRQSDVEERALEPVPGNSVSVEERSVEPVPDSSVSVEERTVESVVCASAVRLEESINVTADTPPGGTIIKASDACTDSSTNSSGKNDQLNSFKRIYTPLLEKKGFEVLKKKEVVFEDHFLNDKPLAFNQPSLRAQNVLGLDYDSSDNSD